MCGPLMLVVVSGTYRNRVSKIDQSLVVVYSPGSLPAAAANLTNRRLKSSCSAAAGGGWSRGGR